MKQLSLTQLIKIPKIRVVIDKSYFKILLRRASCKTNPLKDVILIRSLRISYFGLLSLMRNTKSIPLPVMVKLMKITNESEAKVLKQIQGVCFERSRMPLQIKMPLEVGFEIGNIIGHLLGDGGIDSQHSQPCYSNSNKDLLKEMRKNILDIFAVAPRIWMQGPPTFEGKTTWDKKLSSIDECLWGRNCSLFYPTSVGRILNSLFGNFAKGKFKQIPLEFVNYSKEFKRGLIRTFYDDEGTVGEKNIRVFQSKKEILSVLREILFSIGITPAEIKLYYKNNREHYYFDIFGKTNLETFDKLIGFTSKEKSKKLKKIKLRKRTFISLPLYNLK